MVAQEFAPCKTTEDTAMGEADSKFIWMDGELKPFQEASVHVLSHSLHYGTAAFEGIRAYRTRDGRTAVFRAREHMERFEKSMRAFGGTTTFTTDDLIGAMARTIRANEFDECYVRPIGYIGNSTRGLKLPAHPPMHVAIAAWRWGQYLGAEAMQKGIRAIIASFRRPDVASSLPWAKLSGNYLNSIMARREATLAGVDEAILLDQQGRVAEGTGENIFIVQKGEVLTPPTDAILPGITRESIMDLARHAGLTLREQPLTRNQLYDADEVLFSGTAAEVTPVTEINGRIIGNGKPGPISRQLAELYERATRGGHEEFASWLTYV